MVKKKVSIHVYPVHPSNTDPVGIDWNLSADVSDVLAQFHDFHPTILRIIK
jgi:salicylate hydroxylase